MTTRTLMECKQCMVVAWKVSARMFRARAASERQQNEVRGEAYNGSALGGLLRHLNRSSVSCSWHRSFS